MKLSTKLKLSALTAAILSQAAMAGTIVPKDAMVTPDQKIAIEKVVHDYLVNNPAVLLEASEALQKQQQVTMQREAKSAILKNAPQLVDEKLAVAGNPKGTVTMVEFFDYACGHCQKMKPVVSELIQNDGNLRVVYKEFPIFGKSSELASRAALAAAMQGKYAKMQDELFKFDGHFDEKSIENIAKKAGLNVDKLKSDMNSKAVTDTLASNRQLAEKMRLMGTPAFIILATADGLPKANQEPGFIPGAASAKTLQELIKKAAN